MKWRLKYGDLYYKDWVVIDPCGGVKAFPTWHGALNYLAAQLNNSKKRHDYD